MKAQIFIYLFKSCCLFFVTTLLNSCIEVNYSTPLVDKKETEDIAIFESDSTILYMSGHMKEWNKFWGIIGMDDSPKESDYLALYIRIRNIEPVFIENLSTQVELLKNGKVIKLEDGEIHYDTLDIAIRSRMVSLSDTLRNYNYPKINYNYPDYLYMIQSRDRRLIDSDTLIIKPDIEFMARGRRYHVQRTDTLYRSVKKWIRFMHF